MQANLERSFDFQSIQVSFVAFFAWTVGQNSQFLNEAH